MHYIECLVLDLQLRDLFVTEPFLEKVLDSNINIKRGDLINLMEKQEFVVLNGRTIGVRPASQDHTAKVYLPLFRWTLIISILWWTILVNDFFRNINGSVQRSQSNKIILIMRLLMIMNAIYITVTLYIRVCIKSGSYDFSQSCNLFMIPMNNSSLWSRAMNSTLLKIEKSRKNFRFWQL